MPTTKVILWKSYGKLFLWYKIWHWVGLGLLGSLEPMNIIFFYCINHLLIFVILLSFSLFIFIIMIFVRELSQITFAFFGIFWPRTALVCTFYVVNYTFSDHLPTPKCKRNLWKLPNTNFYIKNFSQIQKKRKARTLNPDYLCLKAFLTSEDLVMLNLPTQSLSHLLSLWGQTWQRKIKRETPSQLVCPGRGSASGSPRGPPRFGGRADWGWLSGLGVPQGGG